MQVYLINLLKNSTFNFSENLLFIPIALIILIFGEILPKTLIRDYSNIMLLFLSPILYIFYIIFYPLVMMINKINIRNKIMCLKHLDMNLVI
jgi:CBS domain containing-hemolysin-like protein